MEEITANMLEIVRKSEMYPEDVTALQQSHGKALMIEELFVTNE